MNKRILLTLLAISLLVLSAAVISCTQAGPVTKTVANTTTSFSTITVTKTQDTLPPGSVPPATPHNITALEWTNCYGCHPIPLGHTGRIAQEEVCSECHYEAPPDQWLP